MIDLSNEEVWSWFDSSSIAKMAYDKDEKTLYVVFQSKHTNGMYSYSNVPKEIYEGLQRAQSIGAYFAHNVKNNYPFTKHDGKY